jgi:hypothetical protein
LGLTSLVRSWTLRRSTDLRMVPTITRGWEFVFLFLGADQQRLHNDRPGIGAAQFVQSFDHCMKVGNLGIAGQHVQGLVQNGSGIRGKIIFVGELLKLSNCATHPEAEIDIVHKETVAAKVMLRKDVFLSS